MNEDFLRIAKCGKPVGLKGEIILWPISNVDSRYEIGSILFINDDYKLVIEKIRNNKDHFIVKFEDIHDRNGAQELTNTVLYAPPIEDELDEGEHYFHDCLGKTIIDQTSAKKGKVNSIISNPASDLLELENGTLIPMHFIIRIDEENIYVDVPEGIFEINKGK